MICCSVFYRKNPWDIVETRRSTGPYTSYRNWPAGWPPHTMSAGSIKISVKASILANDIHFLLIVRNLL